MGNCQAIDNVSLVIQHPKGRVDKLYSPVSAKEIMKINPGHYVALLLTTTLYSSTTATVTTTKVNNNNLPLRVTRIKLLRPADVLVLGHVYRLVTTQEVMKGLVAKKQAKMNNQQLKQGIVDKYANMTEKETSDIEAVLKNNNKQQIRNGRPTSSSRNRSASTSSAWQPSLRSISEAAAS